MSLVTRPARHAFEEHTGEVQMRLEAPTLPLLFVEAARALAEVMGGEPTPARRPGEAQSVVVRARDRAGLLVEWLNELVYQSEMSRRIYDEVRIDQLTDVELSATIHGTERPLVTAVKAATYHDLRVAEATGGGFEATMVLDV